jgi:hypothetical protein
VRLIVYIEIHACTLYLVWSYYISVHVKCTLCNSFVDTLAALFNMAAIWFLEIVKNVPYSASYPAPAIWKTNYSYMCL